MNLPSANSGGFARRAPPPPLPEFFLVLPDGSCTPATPETCRIVMRQARSEARKQARIRRLEKAAELQMALEDRAAARSVQRELAERHRASLRWAGRFKVRGEPGKPDRRTSPVRKRASGASTRAHRPAFGETRPPSSWVTDDLGFRGVVWQQSYLGRKSPRFHRGAACEHWHYVVRDEAVLLGASGEPVIVTNMGADWVEVGAAWQAIEDATTRANGKVQIRCIAPFDSDMSEAEMIAALTHFCTTVLEPLDLPYSAAIHRPPDGGDARNFHPHILLSLRPMRRVEPYCWDMADEVCGELDGRDGVVLLRHLWAHAMTEAAERAGSDRRYTGLGYGARALDLDAGEHLGEARSAIVARGGQVWAHERNRITNQRNALRRAVRDADRKIEALTKVRDAALKRTARGEAPPRVTQVRHAAPQVARAMQRRPAADGRVAGTLPVPDLRARQSLERSTAAAPATPPLDAAPLVQASRQLMLVDEASMLAREVRLRTAARASDVEAAKARGIVPRQAAAKLGAAPGRKAGPGLLTASADVVARGDALGISRGLQVRLPHRSSKPARPPVPFETIPAPATRPMEDEARRLLARARAKRDRMRADKRGRDRHALLGEVPALADRPRRDLLEAFPATPAAAIPAAAANEDHRRIHQLTRIEAYVADYGGEGFDVGTAALKAIGVDDAWLARPWVQRGLVVVRAKQQEVIAAMIADADARPLAYARAGTRFWPRDLDPDRLRRLDRWAADPGFQRDVFAVERRIYQAHQAHDEAARRSAPAMPVLDNAASGSRPAGPPYADGFGGWTDTPPPAFVARAVSPRIAPFDAATGTPHPALLRLLHYAGMHPRALAFADDGKLVTLAGTPKRIEPLIQLWRDDPRVAALLVETVTASRAAGRPVWPEQHRLAIAALVVPGHRRPVGSRRRLAPPDQGRGR